jgi:hypothetical protein
MGVSPVFFFFFSQTEKEGWDFLLGRKKEKGLEKGDG